MFPSYATYVFLIVYSRIFFYILMVIRDLSLHKVLIPKLYPNPAKSHSVFALSAVFLYPTRPHMSRSQKVDFVSFYFLAHFYFILDLF